jgi:hypothetical protein
MFDSMLDLTHILIVFSIHMHVVAVGAVRHVLTGEQSAISLDIIDGMMLEKICNHNLAPLSRKMVLAYKHPRSRKKPKQNIKEELRGCWMTG